MPPSQRRRFRTFQEWAEFVSSRRSSSAKNSKDSFSLRREVYADIEAERGRPLLVYFAETEKRHPPPFENIAAINASDIDGFADLVKKCKRSNSVDVLLHSNGGEAEATERIVKVLRNRFDEVHFLIPHSAYSAATMLALSGDSITLLHPIATLGPIDPQINGVPAASITRGFENAVEKIGEGDAAVLSAHWALIQKYPLHLLERCNDATDLSKKLVHSWLRKYMFKGRGDSDKITGAVDYFASHETHLTHGRPIGWDEIKDKGLNIHLADGEFVELLREAYIMLKHFLDNSPFVKMYESADLCFGIMHQKGRVGVGYRQSEPPPDAPQPPAPPPQQGG